MTQGKGNRDEKLIEELYEKLYWYTYEASEEEFDDKEVDAIVRLLDVLDPKEDDPKFPSDPEAAFERFKSRYGLEGEFAEENVEHKEAVSGGMDSAVSTAADANPGNAGGSEDEAAVGFGGTGSAVLEAEPGADRKPDTDGGEVIAFKEKGKKRSAKWKRLLVRIAAGAAACLVLMLSVNFGSYALKKKSFFEVVRDEVGRTKVTVTGNVDGIDENEANAVIYDSWEEVESLLNVKFLKPTYLPDDYVLDFISINDMDYRKIVLARYNAGEKNIRIKIDLYSNNYSNNTILYDDSWQLVKEDNNDRKIRYYTKDDQVGAFFTDDKAIYFFFTNDSIYNIEEVIKGMS